MKMIMDRAPMGWNSYDYYDTTVTEDEVKANADFMARHLKSCGWEYIVVDIEWYAYDTGSRRQEYQYIPFGRVEMDSYGRLFPCPDKFPSSANGAGFKPLADYVHSLGLKFGIHIMRGIPRIAAHTHTPVLGADCTAADIADPYSISRWNPDMYGVRDVPGGQAYYDSIIGLYADWGVDFIKCDDICNTNMYPHNPYSAAHEIEMIARAIERCGRPMCLSLSPGPALLEKAEHYEKYANMWRITDDFWDQWPLLLDMFDRCERWQGHVAPGSYPDCDMLPLGWLGKGFGQEWYTNFTREEQRTMLTLWCVFGSPLMVGTELTRLDEWTLSLLTNTEVLALLSNDYEGRQVEKTKDYAVWRCDNGKTGEHCLAVFNFQDGGQSVSAPLGELSHARARELWSDDTYELSDKTHSFELPAHGCVLLKRE